MNTEDNKDTKDRVNDRILVGVYGTLKQGEGNHQLLSESAGTKFKGRAYTQITYALADLKYYPGLINGNQIIALELYEITSDTLSKLDRLEGHPSLFVREEIEVSLSDYSIRKAIVYFFNRYSSQPIYKPNDQIVSWSSK